MKNVILIIFFSSACFSAFSQSCNTSGLPYSGDITPGSCTGVFGVYYLADDASDAQLSAVVGNEYHLTSSTEKYIEIFDGSNNFVSDLYIYMDYISFTMDTVAWIPIATDSYNLKIYEIYTCSPSGFGWGEIETACIELPCPYNMAANNLGNYTPDSLGNILNVNMTSGDMITFNGLEGHAYTFSSCNNFNWNTSIWLYDSGGSILLDNGQDECGASNFQSELHWLCDSTGTYEIHLSEFFCNYDGSATPFDFEISSIGVPEFIVNVTTDNGDINIGDLKCDDGNGNCSLRAAIQETNAFLGAAPEINFNLNAIDSIEVINGAIISTKSGLHLNGANVANIKFNDISHIVFNGDSILLENLTLTKPDRSTTTGSYHALGTSTNNSEIRNIKIHNSWRGSSLSGNNNFVHNSEFIENSTQGISFSGSDNLFQSNHFENNGYGAISTNNGWGLNNILSQNTFLCNSNFAYSNHGNGFVEPVIVQSSSSLNLIEGTSNPNATIQLYIDEDSCAATPCQGYIFLGSTVADNAGYWYYSTALQNGDIVTGTSTHNGSTSEFGQCIETITGVAEYDISSTGISEIKLDFIGGIDTTNAEINLWSREQGSLEFSIVTNGAQLIVVPFESLLPGDNISLTIEGIKDLSGNTFASKTFQSTAPIPYPALPQFEEKYLGITLPADAIDYSYNLSTADFDLNGLRDVVFRYHASYGSPTKTLVYLQQSDGLYNLNTYTNSESHSGLTATPDLNNDGYPDIVVSHNVPSSINVRLNNGDGTFGSSSFYSVTNYSSDTEIGDIDNDGDLDIVSMSGNATTSANRISLLLNNGDGTFASQVTINNSIGGQSIHLADLDSDGDLEIAHTSRDTWGGPQKFQVYENDGTGLYTLSVDESISVNTIIADIKDFNNDGYQDILFEVPEVKIYYGNDTIVDYSFINATAINSNNERMLVGDLDGDNDFDLYNKTEWNNSLYDGSNYINSDTLNVGIRHNQFLTDFDLDGDLDLPFVKSDRTVNLLQNTCGEGSNVLVVNTIDDNDDGTCDCNHCSLREAANLASLDTDITTILFEITSSPPHVITLNSRLINFANLKIDLIDSGLGFGDVVIKYNGISQSAFLNVSQVELRSLTIKDAWCGFGSGSIIDSCMFDNAVIGGLGPNTIVTNNNVVNLSPINYWPGEIIRTWHGPVLIKNNVFDLSSGIIGIEMAGWSGGSHVSVIDNTFYSTASGLGRGIFVEGSNHTIVNNHFENLSLAIRGEPNNDDHSDYNLISQNSMMCNGNGIDFISNSTRTVNQNIPPPIVLYVNEDSIIGTSYPNVTIELFSVDETCNGACQGEYYIDNTMSDNSGNWAIALNGLNVQLDDQFTTTQTDSLNNTSEFSNCFIVLPDACGYAEELPVNIEPCNTTGIVLDLKQMTASSPAPTSSCASTFMGNDAWYRVTVPSSGNFLVRQNLNNTVNAVVEAYSGDCNNLFMEHCELLDSLPHTIVFENYSPGSEMFLRVWDSNNTIVASTSTALLHITAHELPLIKTDWELCDEENNYYINGNPTILSERDANSFIIEYEDIATPTEIQEIRDSLILGGGTLIDSCLCGSNPLELWDHETPIEMEENKRGSRLRARVDTSNYNYKFESIEFQINAYAIGEQYNAKVDMDEEGNFVMVWIDKQRRHNYGRVYKSSGNPITQEFQIGASNKTQLEGDVAMDDNGNFTSVWQEINTSIPGSDYEIFGRQYLSDSTAVGAPFNISSDAVCQGSPSNCSPPTNISESARFGTHPTLDTDATGNFIVIWNVGSDIYGQRYSSLASKIGQVFEVAPNRDKATSPSSSVSMNISGTYVVSWTGEDIDDSGIWVQKYNSNGSVNGSEVQVNSYATDKQSKADIALSDDGSFVVTWESYEQEGAGLDYGIYAQRFDSSGTPLGGEIHVNTYTTDAQRHPSISMMNDGTFFIAWSSYGQDGYEEGIYGQFFDVAGNPIDSEFRLNNLVDPEQELPSTATNGESIVIGTWQDGANDGSFTGIFGQRYEIIDAGGQKVYYPIGTATPSTLLGDELTYPGTIYTPTDSLASVRVAIIDTGVDPDHPYLSSAIWNNQQVNSGTTCYVNDTLGYDFVNDVPNPIDYDGHGTKVNGIIARDFPADIQLELMNLKFHEFQKGKVFDAVCAIYYAVDNGADIINMSWGFEASEYPAILKKAIQYASDNDVLMVTTSGNTSKDNDKLNKFPCNLDIPHMIRVTSYEYKSSNNTKKLANYASYGKNNVDIAAYGFVETPTLGDTLELASGTSLAAPHITRTAAIIKGLFPNLTAQDIKDCILNNAAPESELSNVVATGGILDHDAAIDCAYDKAANCVAIDLYINVPQSQDTVYRSDVWVETDTEINSNADVEMWGAEYVKMLPGFETTLGTEYLADIDDCDPLSTPNSLQGTGTEESSLLRLRENSVLAGKIKLQFFYAGAEISMAIINEAGERLRDYNLKPEKEGWYEKIIDAKLLPTGVYTIEMDTGTEEKEQKRFQIQNKHYERYLKRAKSRAEE